VGVAPCGNGRRVKDKTATGGREGGSGKRSGVRKIGQKEYGGPTWGGRTKRGKKDRGRSKGKKGLRCASKMVG